MKNNFYYSLFLLCTFLTSTGFAQKVIKPVLQEMQPVKADISMKTGLETEAIPFVDDPKIGQRLQQLKSETTPEVNIGGTVYDLQTNASICNRFTRAADGTMYATWTKGENSAGGYPDRGTGYNANNGSSWGNIPSARLEQTARTGWPNYVKTEDGTEFIVNHVFDAGSYRLHYLRRAAGETNWMEGDIPTDTPFGSLWPRATVGGADGNSIHVISITTSIALGGIPYEGVNLHVIYHRSTDAGMTWDVVDRIIPGLDSTLMVDLVRSDAYDIDASGDVVAVGLFSLYNDVKVFKSTDNGDSWNNWRILDFPIDQYAIDQGYTEDDLPPYDSLNSPNPLAIKTTDGAGTVIIDNNDVVHAFYGEMYVIDNVPGETGWSYYPCISGISYWNENHGEDSTRTITGLLDLNGNGLSDLDCSSFNFGRYGVAGLTSFPDAGIDDQNNIFLSYQMVMESPDYLNVLDNQHHTHVWVMASLDGGETWSDPYDAINEVTLADEDLAFFTEGVFGHMARRVDGHVHLIYQQDFTPGISVLGDEDPAGPNLINYIAITTEEFGIVSSTDESDIQVANLMVQPNPANDQIKVYYELPTAGKVQISLVNMMGQVVFTETNLSGFGGLNDAYLNISDVRAGIYFLQLQVGETKAVRKLIVQ